MNDDTILWHCRRGILELDLLLNQCFQHYRHTWTPDQKAQFAALLTHPDTLLEHVLIKHQPLPPELTHLQPIIDCLLSFPSSTP